MATEKAADTRLEPEQARRAEAVERAARANGWRPVLGQTPMLPDAPEVEALAAFILTGERQLWATFDRKRPEDDAPGTDGETTP
jgi:hypothetical protein